MKIELRYEPCECAAYEQDAGAEPSGSRPEYYERVKIAAMRFLQLRKDGMEPQVHCGGLHVRGVWVDGEEQ